MLNVHVKRLSEQAIIPTKAHQTDAGWDLYCDQDVTIGMDPVKVSLGLCLAIPVGFFGKIEGRSGLALKGVMIASASDELESYTDHETGDTLEWEVRLGGIIDPEYRGPVFPILATTGLMDDVHFKAGDKVAQLLILPVPEAKMVDVGTRDLPPGERGQKGFGDSDKNASLDSYPPGYLGVDYPGPYDTDFWEGRIPGEGSKIPTSVKSDGTLAHLKIQPDETLEHYIRRLKAECAAIHAREKNPGATVTLSDDFRTMTVTNPPVDEAFDDEPMADDDDDDDDDDETDLDDEEEDDSATVTMGGVQIKVSGVQFKPDGMGGFTASPTSHEDNLLAARRLADSIGHRRKIQDAPVASQDAPGQTEATPKAESPCVSPESPYGKPGGWMEQAFQETRENLVRMVTPKAEWDTMPNAMPLADLVAMKEAILKEVGPGIPIEQAFQPSGDGQSRVETQRDFWKAEASRLCIRFAEVKAEMVELRSALNKECTKSNDLTKKVSALNLELEVARTKLEKKDTVSGKIYRAYKEASIQHMDEQDAVIRELESELASLKLKVSSLEREKEINRKEVDHLMWLALNKDGTSYKSMLKACQDFSQKTKDELSRVKLRLSSDQDALKKAQDEVSRLNHQMNQDRKSHFRAILDEVMNVVQASMVGHLEPAQYDALNAAFDALGKPSPFFGGNRVAKKP